MEVGLAELTPKLEAIFDARGANDLYLRADKAAAYGSVVKAMAAARAAGTEQLGVVTESE